MRVSRTLQIPTYSTKLVIIVSDDVVQEINKVYKKYGINKVETAEPEGVMMTNDLDCYYLILNTSYLTYNTITHETFHVMMHMTRDRGIFEEEAQAWLIGYINQAVFKILDQKKLLIKHG